MQNITTTKRILKVLLVLAWIIFIGLCVEAGSYIVNAVFTFVNPRLVPRLMQEVDLSAIFQNDRIQYFAVNILLSIVTVLKAWLFFLIIKLLHNKTLNLSQPFSFEVQRFIFLASYLSFTIGLFSIYGLKYINRLSVDGLKLPDTQYIHLGGSDVWIFMAIILFVIGQIFKRGIEIQKENELTV